MPVRIVFVNLVLFGCLFCTLQGNSHPVQGGKTELAWIWTSEAAGTKELPAGPRWFRKVFTIDRPIANPVDEAVLEVTADNSFTVWFNGQRIGSGDNWQQVSRFNVKKWAKHGKNVIAIEAENESPGAAALLVRMTVIPNGKSSMAINSDGTWKAATSKPDAAWIHSDYPETDWKPVHVLGEYGTTAPWGMLNWNSGPSSQRFNVPEGFVVETVIPPQPVAPKLNARLPFSIINMTFDARGRLLVSQERGPILLCTEPDQNGELQKIEPYCQQVKNAQGMCWVRDALLVVGDGPQGTGLYRTIDRNHDDVVDEVQLMHKFKGGMGEHGPHAIIHGPDDWLYLVIGNHAWAQPKKLAAHSPLMRWPTGYFGPDQGKPGTTEDVLIPRLNDGRGHAANILAPGGTIWRLDHEGNNMSLFAAGFRNQYDAAFRAADGEMFTFDSDMEWDEGMPWYRPVRVCHVPPGADYLWRTGAANTPNYYLDSLEPMVETGRGSPCGVAVYEHVKYPKNYQGAIFLADWSIGVIWAVHTTPSGAGFQGKAEKFCTGSPLNVTDLEVGPDGSLYFTLGGRGTAGGVYRIRYAKAPSGNDPSARIQPLAAWSKHRQEWKSPALPELAAIQKHLKSSDAYQQRLACEAAIRHQLPVTADDIWLLLNENDQFLRTAARLVLQRLEPGSWVTKLTAASDLQAMEGIVALCKTGNAARYQADVLNRLATLQKVSDPVVQLQQLRTWQLAFIHAGFDGNHPAVQKAISSWFEQFPASDARVNRELGILLSHAYRSGWTKLPVTEKLIAEMVRTQADRPQSIYFFYLLRLLHQGYTPASTMAVLNWFEATKTWSGGHSFAPFMETMFKEWAHSLSASDRKRIVEQAASQPHTATVLLEQYGKEFDVTELVNLIQRHSSGKDQYTDRLQTVALEQLGRQIQRKEVQQALRTIADENPAVLESVVRLLAKAPARENVKYLQAGLQMTSPLVLRDCVQSLAKCDYQPAPEDAAAYRAVILAMNRLEEKDRVAAIRLLQKWKSQRFSADGNDVKQEITGWSRWFNQQFPKEKPIPNVTTLLAASKWKMSEVESFVLSNTPAGQGDPVKGKLIFSKANCIKCHKYGNEGEGLGPDLTTLKSRFQRRDTLEAILDPSKTISDQYRGTVIVTAQGQTITGLAAPQGNMVTVLQTDGTKVIINKADIESQVASTVSPMPEKLIDELTLQEIADLLAYLESNPQ